MESEFVLRILFFLLFILMMLVRSYYGVKSRRRGNRSWQAETEAVNREGRRSIFVGLTLLSSSWPVLALAALSIAVLYRRIGIEERMMLENFGEEYRAYIQSTGRLLPRIGLGTYRDHN